MNTEELFHGGLYQHKGSGIIHEFWIGKGYARGFIDVIGGKVSSAKIEEFEPIMAQPLVLYGLFGVTQDEYDEDDYPRGNWSYNLGKFRLYAHEETWSFFNGDHRVAYFDNVHELQRIYHAITGKTLKRNNDKSLGNK